MLDVTGLSTEYVTRGGLVRAVDDISFTIDDGRLVGLVGESGCGKTATVRSIMGLISPPGRVAAGRIDFNGVDLRSITRSELRRIRGKHIGFVAQNPFAALNPILRIEDQFHNVLAAHGPTSRRESRAAALRGLESVGIAGAERVLQGYAHELSGGMAQRVVIAIALLLGPKLVIADEPTTALDVTVQRQILDLIRGLLGAARRSMLLVTHDLGVVAQYCDDVIVMYGGRIVERGTVADVLARPLHPYTRALLDAIPRPGRALVGLAGSVPNVIDRVRGCLYRERCSVPVGDCTAIEPVLRSVGGRRFVSCHRPAVLEEEAAS